MLVVAGIATVVGAAVSCSATREGAAESGSASDEGSEVLDGLVRTQIDMPGVLYVRADHGIGSYDEFLIPEASISYRSNSSRLPIELEDMFLASLEQSLIDAATEARIPVVQSPGPCVLQVGMGLTNVVIERASSRSIGQMTLVMEFRDTQSGTPLLRYAVPNKIERDGTGDPRSEQIRLAFDEMVGEMEISGALRAAGLSDGPTRPECNGTLARRGAGSLPAVSAD